ncbi:MAG TPA: hypothetical protein DCR21_07345 [Succinivibrionaceae bacterium]|nr:hypothetical protein [Succinivibrionaceae bacterium]
MFSKLLLCGIIAVVVFFTLLGIKRIFSVFFGSSCSCHEDGKMLAKRKGSKSSCCCSGKTNE